MLCCCVAAAALSRTYLILAVACDGPVGGNNSKGGADKKAGTPNGTLTEAEALTKVTVIGVSRWPVHACATFETDG